MSATGSTWASPSTACRLGTGESGSRKKKQRRWRRFYGRRTCPTCGQEFRATHNNQRFCPPTETDRAKGNRQARSWCAKAFQNATERGTLDQLLARVREHGGRLEEFDCAHSGKRCEPGINVPPQATRFCSREHKGAWHRGAERESA